jgi:DNA replication and repair protein RecF
MYLPNVAELSHQHLDQNIDKEIQLQNTLFGPHKDDFDVIIKSKLSKNQLSRGEQRTVGLSILFSVHSLIKEKLDLSPVLLLDDIASELDVIRVDFLMKYIPESQVIITTTEKINSDHISNIINL